jgi:hypothetical protein
MLPPKKVPGSLREVIFACFNEAALDAYRRADVTAA